MKRTATALLTLGILTAAIPAWAGQGDPASEPMRFGMDSNSIAAQSAAGVHPDYGTFWVGPWTLKHGWYGPDNQMASMRQQGVTPAIHFYYWGDDISQSCIEKGCWSSLHGAQKDKAGWDRLATELTTHLDKQMGGEPVVIFLETEFNKADVQNYEPLDGYLAEKARQIHAGYPNAHIVLSLGNWNSPAWKTWDRAAAESDAIGLQGMRGSTRDSLSHYQGLYESTVTGAKTAKALFDKPIFIQDIALSSYPEPQYIQHQTAELQQFFSNIDELQAIGVEAMVYRSWRNTNMDLNNYYGEAERHWGFAYQDGTHKPSSKVWIDGVKAERAGGSSGPSTPPGSFEPQFQLGNVNEWWVDVRVSSTMTVASVSAIHDGKAPVALGKSSWGTWSKSFHAPAGGEMVFRATDTYGRTVDSAPMPWLKQPNRAPTAAIDVMIDGMTVQVDASRSADADGDTLSYSYELGDGATATGRTATHTYQAAGQYQVVLKVSDGTATTTATRSVTVEAPNKAPVAALVATADGLKVHVDASASSDADGDALTYSYNFGDGATATGATATHTYKAAGTYVVGVTVSDGEASAKAEKQVVAEAPPFGATFTPSKNVNPWWVDVKVDANGPVAKVEASVNGGSFVTLEKTNWGTYAKSFHAPRGHIVFTATDTAGQKVTSERMSWLGGSAEPTPAPQPTPQPAPQPFDAQFAAKGNPWWVEASVQSASKVTKVEASVNGGSFVTLPPTSWGAYAKSFHAPAGTIVLRATNDKGQTDTSEAMPWLKSEFKATFTPKPGNAWWVETKVDANEGVAKVEASVNGGAYKPLKKTSWGTYAESFNVGTNGKVQFRAVSVSGDTATSSVTSWN